MKGEGNVGRGIVRGGGGDERGGIPLQFSVVRRAKEGAGGKEKELGAAGKPLIFKTPIRREVENWSRLYLPGRLQDEKMSD